MQDKRSRKPLFIGLLALVIVVLGAAMLISPTVTPKPIEEQLSAESFLK